MHELSADYDKIYNSLLQTVGVNHSEKPKQLTAFWPMRGHQYDGDLYVIGRVTNGWNETWEKEMAADVAQRIQLLTKARSGSESNQRCPLLWVIDRAGDPVYNTNASAFWRVIKRVSLEGNHDLRRAAAWPSWICYSNLHKVAPDSRYIKPSAAFKRMQLSHSIRLIAQELIEFNPRRVLVLAGQDWFSPFEEGLGLKIKWRTGLVEGVSNCANRRWVIAKHPMLKPENQFVDEVLEAFAGRLGV